ncbi:MAG: hypothetical protein AAF840_18475, partial [Bacteroidota bacterium]
LDQTLPTNYLAQDASGSTYPVWTATDAPNYKHRIIGLAQDSAAALRQIHNVSVLAPELLQLDWSTPSAGTAYLMVADNGAPTARTSPPDSNTTVQLLQRQWRMELTGTTPATQISINPRQLFARPVVGEKWVLRLTTATGLEYLPGTVQANGLVQFDLPVLAPGEAFFQLGLSCPNCKPPQGVPINNFFSTVRLSPNPVEAGSPTQLRVALKQTAGLVILAYDPLGREVFRRALPANSHHLTDLTFPAAGTYSLHLRSRLRHRNAPHYTLRVVVQ